MKGGYNHTMGAEWEVELQVIGNDFPFRTKPICQRIPPLGSVYSAY